MKGEAMQADADDLGPSQARIASDRAEALRGLAYEEERPRHVDAAVWRWVEAHPTVAAWSHSTADARPPLDGVVSRLTLALEESRPALTESERLALAIEVERRMGDEVAEQIHACTLSKCDVEALAAATGMGVREIQLRWLVYAWARERDGASAWARTEGAEAAATLGVEAEWSNRRGMYQAECGARVPAWHRLEL